MIIGTYFDTNDTYLSFILTVIAIHFIVSYVLDNNKK